MLGSEAALGAATSAGNAAGERAGTCGEPIRGVALSAISRSGGTADPHHRRCLFGNEPARSL